MRQPRQVLIVDDRSAVRQALQALLALWPDVECVGEAADGQEGVKLAAEKRPDVVLMDVQMRGMGGLEATRLIKSEQPEVRVVVLTLHSEYEDDALAAGADAFLVKGGPPEALRDAICKTSMRESGSGGGCCQGTDATQRGDKVGFDPSTFFDCLRKNTARPVYSMPKMIPWNASIPNRKELAWANTGCAGNL